METDLKDRPIEKIGRPNIMYEELRSPVKVALKILEYNDVLLENINFTQLCKDLEGKGASRGSVHEALNELTDRGTLHAGWQKNKDNHWIRTYHITGEEQKRLLRKLYRATHEL
ncbi:hypothetical protein [Candidatus Bathycorpusculum sp.]|uniref:hypothetical protein n=1 Tax=Candidatus Bathycorpusculum sp. TaxID=2994959 RepID=UPI0028274FD5|nr:hypothetical protein [Candidatus Termitimicrobium sp.]